MSIPNDLRQMNRRQVLLASLKSGPATRSTLSRATGISQPTTGKIIDELINDGVLRSAAAVSPVQSGPGRPGFLVQVDDVQPRFLGVQLSPDQTRITPLAVAPQLRDVWAKTIPTEASLPEWIESVLAAARPFLKQRPVGLLVSLPGVLDHDTGNSLMTPHLLWAGGEAVAAALGSAMRLPAFPVQATQCLALGHRAANPTAEHFLMVDFGAGIGSAAVLNGGLFRGPLPFAGEIGHTPVAGHTALCACGGVGCLETLAGRGQLFGPHAAEGDAELLSPAEGAALEKPAIRARVVAALEAAGFAIASAMNVLGLSHVVVNGFVADLPADLFDVLRHGVTSAATAARFGAVRVDAAPRHCLAGLASVGIDRMIVPA